MLKIFSNNSTVNLFQALNFGTVQSAYPSTSILLVCRTYKMCSLRMTSRYKNEEIGGFCFSATYNATRMSIFEHSEKEKCYESVTCCLFRSTTPHVGIPIWRPSLRLGSLCLQSRGECYPDIDRDKQDSFQWIFLASPEENVERMQMPRASIFASTKETLNTINTIRPKVEKKEERASIISRPTMGIKLNHIIITREKTYSYLPSVSPLVEVKEEKSFLYAESKRAKLEREKEERRQRMEEDFSPEDLALATVPGYDFDPKERAFQMDELRPQPIIRWRLSSEI